MLHNYNNEFEFIAKNSQGSSDCDECLESTSLIDQFKFLDRSSAGGEYSDIYT